MLHALSLALLALVAQGPALSDADREVLQSIRTAYQANRAAFPLVTSRFRFSVGDATDATSAFRGNWTHRSVAAGFYAFDGARGRFEIVHSLDDHTRLRSSSGDSSWSSPIASTRVLTDGRLTLEDFITPSVDGRELVHTAFIYPGTERFYSAATFPLALGLPQDGPFPLANDLDELLDGSRGHSLAEPIRNERLGETDVVQLTIETTHSRRDYWIDLERGAVPRRVLSTPAQGGTTIELVRDDLRLEATGGWFPHKEAIYFGDGMVKLFEIEEADFTNRPSGGAFRLDFDQPVAMVNIADSVRYTPRKTWDLAALPPKDSPRAEPIEINRQSSSPPVMPGERSAWLGTSTAWILAGGVALVAVAGILAWRRGRA